MTQQQLAEPQRGRASLAAEPLASRLLVRRFGVSTTPTTREVLTHLRRSASGALPLPYRPLEALHLAENAPTAPRRLRGGASPLDASSRQLRNFAAAIGEVHAVRAANLTLDRTPGRWRIGAGDWVTVTATEPVQAQESVACGIPGFDHPGLELRTELLEVDDAPLEWSIRGRCGFTTSFDYQADD